jgi:hypothetical protein
VADGEYRPSPSSRRANLEQPGQQRLFGLQ